MVMQMSGDEEDVGAVAKPCFVGVCSKVFCLWVAFGISNISKSLGGVAILLEEKKSH